MDNYEDEVFIRIILFRGNFVEAVKCFEHAKKAPDNFVRYSLIKMGIITYAKPFMKNAGVHKEANGYRLPKSVVPKDYQWLHEMFLNYRGNFIGHSNFNTMKPNIGASEKTQKGQMIPIQYTDISFDHWFEIDEEFPEEPYLIDHAIALVNGLLEDMPGATYTTKEVFSNEQNT